MRRGRMLLLATSALLVLLVLGGSVAVRVGATDSSYRQVVRFSEVLSLVLENYVDPVDSDALLQGAYEGMLNGLDASGTFLTPAEMKEWQATDAGAVADPGLAVLKTYGALQVIRVPHGSPAERASIVAGDQIRRINGRPIRDISLEQALRMLRGKPGSAVALGILHAKAGIEREDVDVQRVVRTESAFSMDVIGETAVLRVVDLSRVQEEDLTVELAALPGKSARRLLIDLRDEVEGSPRDAMRVLNSFVSGDTLRLRERNGKVVETLKSSGSGNAWPGAIAVLVNGATAGGAEAVARVLQVRRGAAVLGEGTFGWASEPKLFKLSNGSGLLLAAQLWETSTAESWETDGVKPDVSVAAGSRTPEALADQLQRALQAFESRDREAEPQAKKAAA